LRIGREQPISSAEQNDRRIDDPVSVHQSKSTKQLERVSRPWIVESASPNAFFGSPHDLRCVECVRAYSGRLPLPAVGRFVSRKDSALVFLIAHYDCRGTYPDIRSTVISIGAAAAGRNAEGNHMLASRQFDDFGIDGDLRLDLPQFMGDIIQR
jgi:hypothetical protein